MKKYRFPTVIIIIIAISFLFVGCNILDKGLDHYLPYTSHLEGTEYYISGTGSSAEYAAQVLPDLSDFSADTDVSYQYDYKKDGIDDAECSYLTVHFQEADYKDYKEQLTQDRLQKTGAHTLTHYMLPKDDRGESYEFMHGTFLFDPQYALEQDVIGRPYLRLIGFDDANCTVIFLYLHVGISATSMTVDNLLCLDFFSNYPGWNAAGN